MYDFEKVKEAILFNTQEVLPTNLEDLDKEIRFLVENANISGETIKHYIGFEISGKIHLGTGMMTAIKVKKLQDAGIECAIWFANYHTWLNKKLDGTMKTIQEVKDEYFKPIFKSCLASVGCDIDKIKFLDADVLYDKSKYKHESGLQFWDFMMNVSLSLTLSRVNKSISITGKKSGDGVEFAILTYPVMQVADAFFFNAHIVHAGMDQRKCHVLMREVAFNLSEEYQMKINQKRVKPIAVHHNLLLSLGVDAKSVSKKMNFKVNEIDGENDKNGENEDLQSIVEEMKMSKSKPDSAIWVHDNPSEVARKVKGAYCPAFDANLSLEENINIQKFNPVLNWLEYLFYPAGFSVNLERSEKFGGIKHYQTYKELFDDYLKGLIHPLDLKNALVVNLNTLLEPVVRFGEEIKDKIEFLENLAKK
jgi:tyrosyl-tRNA synthetase